MPERVRRVLQGQQHARESGAVEIRRVHCNLRPNLPGGRMQDDMHGSGGVAAAPSTSKCVGNVFQGPEFLRCTYADCAYYIVQEINEKKYIKKKMAFASPEFVQQQQQQQQESTSIFGRVWNGLYNTFFGSSSSKL